MADFHFSLQLTYFDLKVFTSSVFSRYVVRSLIVSEAVVPLIVSSKKTSPTQSSNLSEMRCVVSRGRFFRSIRHLPMLMVFVHTTTSSSWSSSKRCKSNCSSHFARGDGLDLYFSLPSLQEKKKIWDNYLKKVSNFARVQLTNLNFTKGSSPASIAGRPFASTKSIVTTELQICDFKRFDASANFGLRWKYCKYVKVLCYEQKEMERSRQRGGNRRRRRRKFFFVDFHFHSKCVFFMCKRTKARHKDGNCVISGQKRRKTFSQIFVFTCSTKPQASSLSYQNVTKIAKIVFY